MQKIQESPDLIEIDKILLKHIKKTPGIAFWDLCEKVKRRWSHHWVSKRLIHLQESGIIVRTKNGAARPTRSWLPDDPNIPWGEVIRK